jgi:hypothetical protein
MRLQLTQATLVMMFLRAVASASADEVHTLPSEAFKRQWSAAVWTKAGETAQWPEDSAREYCSRFAERITAQWSRLAEFPKSTFLRVTIMPGNQIAVDANPEPFWKHMNPSPIQSPVLEQVVYAALPPLAPPMSREGSRVLNIGIAFDATDQDNQLFRLLGMPIAGFPPVLRDRGGETP